MWFLLPCKVKTQYLLTLHVSRYCILALQSAISKCSFKNNADLHVVGPNSRQQYYDVINLANLRHFVIYLSSAFVIFSSITVTYSRIQSYYSFIVHLFVSDTLIVQLHMGSFAPFAHRGRYRDVIYLGYTINPFPTEAVISTKFQSELNITKIANTNFVSFFP